MVELADIVRSAGPAYVASHVGQLLPSHRRALNESSAVARPLSAAHSIAVMTAARSTIVITRVATVTAPSVTRIARRPGASVFARACCLAITTSSLSHFPSSCVPWHAHTRRPSTPHCFFRAKLRAALARSGLDQEIDPAVWNQRWIVHVQHIGTGEHALRYLSRYVYRVALNNHRIERFEHGRVTFSYTHARSGETRRVTLPVHAFLARFLQHVLPRGFAKIRSYGLLSPSRRPDLERTRYLLHRHSVCSTPTPDTSGNCNANTATNCLADTTDAWHVAAFTASVLRCPVCDHGILIFVERLKRSRAPP